MTDSPPNHESAWAAGLLVAAIAGVVVAAELQGPRLGVYGGGAAGLVVGLSGWAVAWRIAVQHRRHAQDRTAQWDIWPLWAGGLLLRLVLTAACAGVFWFRWRSDFMAALLALASVYLVLLAGETLWLYRKIVPEPGRTEAKHG